MTIPCIILRIRFHLIITFAVCLIIITIHKHAESHGNFITIGPCTGVMCSPGEKTTGFVSAEFTFVWVDLLGVQNASLPAPRIPEFPVPWISAGVRNNFVTEAGNVVSFYAEAGIYAFVNIGAGYNISMKGFSQLQGAHLFIGIPLITPFEHFFWEPYYRRMLNSGHYNEFGIMFKLTDL